MATKVVILRYSGSGRCWSRRIQLHDEEATLKKVKKNRHRMKSFPEAITALQNSPRQEFSSHHVSFQEFSPRVSDHSCLADKINYPLPLPLSSLEPSIRSNGFSSLSCGSDDNYDELVRDNVPFVSFRTYDDSRPNTWSTITTFRTSMPYSSSSKYPMLNDTSFRIQTEGNENSSHPMHPLPRPPTSATKPSGLLESTWRKGKLLGRGTFGHVYAGFDSENGKMCAIKEVGMIYDDHTSKECLKQLNQEIAVLSHLSHPNIVKYYGSEIIQDVEKQVDKLSELLKKLKYNAVKWS